MQVGDDFLQGFLGFIFAGHILEQDAGRGLDIDPGIGFSHIEHQGCSAAFLIHIPPHHQLSDRNEEYDRQDPRQQEADQRGCLFTNL